MVITASLAHGAVREAVRLNIAKVEAMWDAQMRSPIMAPATHRRFDEWFRLQRRIFEQAALLIVFGKIGRRRGAFSAFIPSFQETDGIWELDIEQISVQFSPGRLERMDIEPLAVSVSGHALERMFQRTESIEWPVIRDCLAGATLFLNAGIAAYRAMGCRQCAIPAGTGLLLGQVIEDRLALRTFVPGHELQPRYRTLMSDLDQFMTRHHEAVEASALTPDPQAATVLQELLSRGPHKWMMEPYTPGVDPRDKAWDSRIRAPSTS